MLAKMLQIRRFTPSDHAAVVRLHNQALGPTGAHLGPGPWDDDLDLIAEVYLENSGDFLVAMLDDELVAMGALLRIDGQTAEIKRMRTAPAVQRQGYGRLVLARLETRASELGYSRLCLDTTDKQTAARRLYETAGYLHTRCAVGPGQDELLIYEKSLDA